MYLHNWLKEQSDQGLHCLPEGGQIKVYTVCLKEKSDQGLHCLPEGEVYQDLHCLPEGEVRSGSTLFAWRSSQIRSTPFAWRRSQIRVYTVCLKEKSDQGLHCLPEGEVRSGSTLSAILSASFGCITVLFGVQDDYKIFFCLYQFLGSFIFFFLQ